MAEDNNRPPGITTLLGRLVRTGVGAVQNRFELLAVEWQEEKARLTELLMWLVGLLFFGIMAALLLTATIIFLVPENARVYVAAGFTALYIVGAIVAWVVVRSLLKREPFNESVEQAKRDRTWLKSFN